MCDDYLLDECLSAELMKEMMESGQKPEGEELLKILYQWFNSGLQGTNSYIGYRFLSWLLRGRVNETIELLEESDEPDYPDLANRLREIGNKRFPSGAGAYIAHGLWGWLCIEIGNPDWQRDWRGQIIIELPTTTKLETYMKEIGGNLGKNGFFRAGFWKKTEATPEQFSQVYAIARSQKLKAHHLPGGGCRIASRQVPLPESFIEARRENDAMEENSGPTEDNLVQGKITDNELAQIDADIESETDGPIIFPFESGKEEGIIKIMGPSPVEFKDDELYDIAADPGDFKSISMRKGKLDIGLFKANIEQSGYFGYRRDHPRLGPVIAIFKTDNLGTPDTDKTVGIYEAIKVLGKSQRACERLAEGLGGERGRIAATIMSWGKGFPESHYDLEEDVCNFFCEDIYDMVEPVWEGTICNPYDKENQDQWYPVQVCEYEGVFFVWALESDPEGYFLNFESAKQYAMWNWDCVIEMED